MSEPRSSATPGPDHRPNDAADRLRRDLIDDGDGDGRVLATIGRGLGLLSAAVLAVLAVGVVAAVLAVLAFRDRLPVLAFALVLCLPALVAPLIARFALQRLRRSITHPREATRQLGDLLKGVRDSPEVRELADRFRARGTSDGPVEGPRRGRVRRTVRTARLISGVVGAAEPDADRHALLLPFTPERTARLFGAITWSGWGVLLGGAVVVVAATTIVVDAL